jgi:hypothetical protein
MEGMFSAAKDAIASRAAQTYVNGRIARYGQLIDLHLDSTQRRIEATCLLHGEAKPIDIVVDSYVIHSVGAQKFLEVQSFQCARPWLQALLEDFVRGRRIELPNWAAAVL